MNPQPDGSGSGGGLTLRGLARLSLRAAPSINRTTTSTNRTTIPKPISAKPTVSVISAPHLGDQIFDIPPSPPDGDLDRNEKQTVPSAKVAKAAKVTPPLRLVVEGGESFSEAFAALAGQCPEYVDGDRWQQAVEDGQRFLAAWGEQAAALALQLLFCFEVRTLSDRLVSSAPE
jgi:hypothetical protein